MEHTRLAHTMDTFPSSGYPEDQSPGLFPPESKEKTEEPTERDWAELPRDALLLVLEKLHQVDILQRAELVCRPWQRAARDEPSLWRRIDIRYSNLPGSHPRGHLRFMARAAVRRSTGGCEAFLGVGVVHDWLIFLLEHSARRLKSFRIISCENITDERFSRDIFKFYMLEELEISNCDPAGTFATTCLAAADACPHLKRLRLSSPRFYKGKPRWVDREVKGITKMHGLRSLQLFAQSIGTDGLASILENCAKLESLDIRHCFNVEMGDEMVARCSMFETLKLPYDSTDDYDLEFSAPEMDPNHFPPRSTYYECYTWGNLYEFG